MKGKNTLKNFCKILFVLFVATLANAKADVADIVNTQTLTGQTSSDNTVTLFTPSTTALYRVNVYSEFSTSIGNNSASVHFTSSNGSATKAVTCNNVNDSGASSCIAIVRATSSGAITVEFQTGNPTPTYDLYIVTEQLN